MKSKFDSMVLGFLLGVISPIIGFFIYYFAEYSYMTMRGFVNYLVLGQVYTPLISLCVVANLPVFYIFLRMDKYYSARGIILSTFLYAGLVFYLKFLS